MFFDEIFNDTDKPQGWGEDLVKEYGPKESPDLFEKAQQDDIDAMFKLADMSANSDETPAVVAMYWLSRIAQLKETAKPKKALAELKLNMIGYELHVKYLNASKGITENLLNKNN